MPIRNMGVFERPDEPRWEPFKKAFPDLNTEDWDFVCLRQAEAEQPARYFYRHRHTGNYLTLDAMGNACPPGDEEAQLRLMEQVDEMKKKGAKGHA